MALFTALPRRFPAKDVSAFEQLVAEDVQVYRDGKLFHRTRAAWIAELQSYKQTTPDSPQGWSVSRDQFHRQADGGISVREFTYPIPPEGKMIVYHPNSPLRYVTYYLDAGRVVRVSYGPAMSDYRGLCQAIEGAKTDSTGRSVCG